MAVAAPKPTASGRLCGLFDERTNDGSDMEHCDGLLKKALASIAHTFQRRAATSLLSSRGVLLPTAAEVPTAGGDEFDLVTWLVTLDGKTDWREAILTAILSP